MINFLFAFIFIFKIKKDESTIQSFDNLLSRNYLPSKPSGVKKKNKFLKVKWDHGLPAILKTNTMVQLTLVPETVA